VFDLIAKNPVSDASFLVAGKIVKTSSSILRTQSYEIRADETQQQRDCLLIQVKMAVVFTLVFKIFTPA